MKTKRKLDIELYNIFSEVCADEESCLKTVSESKKAFSLIKQDALYRKLFIKNEG